MGCAHAANGTTLYILKVYTQSIDCITEFKAKKLAIRFIRVMAFSTEEKGSPYDFDYKIYFSKLIKVKQSYSA